MSIIKRISSSCCFSGFRRGLFLGTASRKMLFQSNLASNRSRIDICRLSRNKANHLSRKLEKREKVTKKIKPICVSDHSTDQPHLIHAHARTQTHTLTYRNAYNSHNRHEVCADTLSPNSTRQRERRWKQRQQRKTMEKRQEAEFFFALPIFCLFSCISERWISYHLSFCNICFVLLVK